MHIKGFLHRMLSPVMHQKRLSTLSDLIEGLLTSKRLSVTDLGRGMKAPITERSAIRKADRCIGNEELQRELPLIYRTIAFELMSQLIEPRIIVDWSHIPNTKQHVLRAAFVAKGRALSIYEEVHSEKKLGNRNTERNFLRNLNYCIPIKCTPIIITDAGFDNEWFKRVIKLGWNYIGRVRGQKVYCQNDKWSKCQELMLKATDKPVCIGKIMLCKANSLNTQFFLFKGPATNKKRYKPHKSKDGGRNEKNYHRSGLEPWLLVSSLKVSARKVIKIYKERMQIEESFRDLKSPKFGFGLRNAYSKKSKRIRILLLIAMIASLIAWLSGRIMEKQKLHYDFQSNSIGSRRTISLFFIGCRAIARGIEITSSSLRDALLDVQEATL